jgi:sulfate adenylyltransferase
MSDLIPVHGGLSAPVDRTVPADRVEEFKKQAAALAAVTVDDADLSSLYRFGDGGLSPLTGPMDKEAWHRSLDEGVVRSNGKSYAWTIPISFPIAADEAASLKPGQRVRLIDSRGATVAMLKISDVFPYEKRKYIKCVYQTDRTDHPGGRMVTGDPRDMLVGGEVDVLPQPKHPEYGRHVLRPAETRKLLKDKGWTRVVALRARVRAGVSRSAVRHGRRRPQPARRRDEIGRRGRRDTNANLPGAHRQQGARPRRQ